jgi:hypothetical protein
MPAPWVAACAVGVAPTESTKGLVAPRSLATLAAELTHSTSPERYSEALERDLEA